MGFEDYISECEAAAIAGVSGATLNRFAEAGYLRIETDSDGLRLFSKKELRDVFGIHKGQFTEKIKDVPNEANKRSFGSPDWIFATKPSAKHEQDSVEAKSVTKRKETTVPPRFMAENTWPTDTSAQQVICAEDDFWSQDPRPASFTVQKDIPADMFDTPTATQVSEPEPNKTENIVKLQEQLLEARDQEIRELKQQRNWLQARVEKLEEKSDRDQLLLLSEKQMMRHLLSQNEKRRPSPLRVALEWFGLVPTDEERQQTESNGTTIEVSDGEQGVKR